MRIDLPNASLFSEIFRETTGAIPLKNISGICTDSREIKTGDLYLALKGSRVDGHDFLNSVFKKGASCALVTKKVNRAGQQIVVQDPLITMGEIALKWRNQFDIPVIGVTGTNGKTTTKELLKHILSENFHVHANAGNFNTSVSLPLTLLTLNENHTCSILEMGASQRGDIGRLCRIANPTHGIITNIAPAHLEGFGSIEAVAQTKAELFEALDSGLSFINVSDKRIKKLHTAGKTISFGFAPDSDYSADIFQKQDGTLILIIEAHEINTGSQNNSFAKNVLSAIAIARELGISWDIIKRRVLSFSPLEGRCRIIKFGELTIIDDTYNANPESTFSAINFLLALQDGGQKIFIFGDMFELGKDSYEQHRNIGLKCIRSGLSAVLTIGSETRATDSVLNGSLYHKHFDDKESLLKDLKKILKNGDKILIKGSRGLAMETIVKKLQEN